MHAQRKPLPSTRYHLPQGTRRELRGQVIQWRQAAAEKRAPQGEQLLTPAMSKRAGDIGIALLAIAALVVFGARVGGWL